MNISKARRESAVWQLAFTLFSYHFLAVNIPIYSDVAAYFAKTDP